jgi:hypothetical protein
MDPSFLPFENLVKPPSMIIEKLYLSGFMNSKRKDILQELGVRYILIVGKDLLEYFPDEFIYKRLEIRDDPKQDISIYFNEAYEWVLYISFINIYFKIKVY